MKQNTKNEFLKFPTNDVIDKIPDPKPTKSYNEEYFSSVAEIKMINVPIEKDNKLFYEFEFNENASISTTTGQINVIFYIKKLDYL